MQGARLCVDGCGRVWTGARVWMEQGGERDWVWTGVDGGVDGTGAGARLGVDGGVDGRWRGARLGVDGCGRGCGWKMEGSETGCGWVWAGRVWTGSADGRWRGARLGVDGSGWVWTGVWMEDGGRDWVRLGRCGRGLDGRRKGADSSTKAHRKNISNRMEHQAVQKALTIEEGARWWANKRSADSRAWGWCRWVAGWNSWWSGYIRERASHYHDGSQCR